jgi:hypothetical protein
VAETTASWRFSLDINKLLAFNGLWLKACNADPQLAAHVSLTAELVYCRFVDRYLQYISDVLAGLFTLRPEMLKSNDKVEVEFILEHRSMEELVQSLIERKVMTLSYKGMREVSAYFTDRLKIPLFDSKEQLEVGVLAVEMRNLFTHNQGVVNRVFQERVPFFKCSLGQRVDVTTEGFFGDHAGLLLTSVQSIHDKILEKFGKSL